MKPILTATVGTNADLFPSALALYAKEGDKILDMTYGKGVFWRNADTSKYDLIRNDINPTKGDVHRDFRDVGFPNVSFNVVILDPPYMFGAGGKDSVMDSQYENGLYRQDASQKGVPAIIELYKRGMAEGVRVLKRGGILFVKCMDLISGGKQHRVHQDIFDIAVSQFSMLDEDLFILLSKTPVMRHDYQLHARKNNSFLWVFRKTGERKWE